MPRAWTLAALLARISLLLPSEKRLGSNVPTRHRNWLSWASLIWFAAGGGVKFRTLLLQLGPPWHVAQPAVSNRARPRLTLTGLPLATEIGEIGARTPLARYVAMASRSGSRPVLLS